MTTQRAECRQSCPFSNTFSATTVTGDALHNCRGNRVGANLSVRLTRKYVGTCGGDKSVCFGRARQSRIATRGPGRRLEINSRCRRPASVLSVVSTGPAAACSTRRIDRVRRTTFRGAPSSWRQIYDNDSGADNLRRRLCKINRPFCMLIQ